MALLVCCCILLCGHFWLDVRKWGYGLGLFRLASFPPRPGAGEGQCRLQPSSRQAFWHTPQRRAPGRLARSKLLYLGCPCPSPEGGFRASSFCPPQISPSSYSVKAFSLPHKPTQRNNSYGGLVAVASFPVCQEGSGSLPRESLTFAVWPVTRELTFPTASERSSVCIKGIADKLHRDTACALGGFNVSVQFHCGSGSPGWLHRGLNQC